MCICVRGTIYMYVHFKLNIHMYIIIHTMYIIVQHTCNYTCVVACCEVKQLSYQCWGSEYIHMLTFWESAFPKVCFEKTSPKFFWLSVLHVYSVCSFRKDYTFS